MQTAVPFSVQCPSCETTFPVDPRRVPSGGVSAICSQCMRVFRVEVPDEVSDVDEFSAPIVDEGGVDVEDHGVEADVDVGDDGEDVDERDAGEDVDVEDRGVDVGVGDRGQEADTESHEQSDWSVDEEREVEADTTAETALDESLATDTETEPPDEIEIEGRDDASMATGEIEVDAEPEVAATAESDSGTASPVAEQSLSRAASRFGTRDPHDRAKRLARVLVSDMLTYHPARYEQAHAEGTLREQFEEEIRLSWEEYEEQVGADLAESTDYFIIALNEILARGETLFRGSGRPE